MNDLLGGVLAKLKQRFCSHRFASEDLQMVNRESEGGDRVSWACDKCGKVFRAHCGLDISPEHGPTFRRKTTPNAEVTGRPLADGPVDRRVVRQTGTNNERTDK